MKSKQPTGLKRRGNENENKFNKTQQEIIKFFCNVVSKNCVPCFKKLPIKMASEDWGVAFSGFIVTSGELRRLIENQKDYIVYYNSFNELVIYKENKK